MDSRMMRYHTILICLLSFKLATTFPLEANGEVTINKATQIAAVNYGDNILLECNFNQMVDCGWQRRDILINPIQRYRYKNGNGKETEDCSLRISNVQEIDIGQWRCESLGTSDIQSVPGSAVMLTKKSPYDPPSKKPNESTTTVNPPLSYYTTDGTAIETTTAYLDNNILTTESIAIIVGLAIIIAILVAALIYLIKYPTRHQTSNSGIAQESASNNLEAQLLNTNDKVDGAKT